MGGEEQQGRVMCIGRSDCLGGAGVQGDLKAITALGGYGMTVVAMVTAADGIKSFDNVELSPTIIVRQMESIVDEIGIDCVRLGQLSSGEQIDIVANTLERLLPDMPMVIAPAILNADGTSRMSTRTLAALKRRLIVNCTVISLSVPEAELLTGMEVNDIDAMTHAALMLLTLGCKAVFVHGAAFSTNRLTDILATEDDVITYEDSPSQADDFYGAKTALAAAIAASLAQGLDIRPSVERSRNYVHEGMRQGLEFGEDHMTLNYTHTTRQEMRAAAQQ